MDRRDRGDHPNKILRDLYRDPGDGAVAESRVPTEAEAQAENKMEEKEEQHGAHVGASGRVEYS